MPEPGGDPDFLEEPLRPHCRRQLLVQHLEGDRAIVPEVLGEVDGRHAPAPELPLDRVALRESSAQAVRQITDGVLREPGLWLEVEPLSKRPSGDCASERQSSRG